MQPLGFSSLSVPVASKLVRKPGSMSVVDGDVPFELAAGTPFSTRPRPSAQVGDVSRAVNATDPAINDKRIGLLPADASVRLRIELPRRMCGADLIDQGLITA